MRVGKEVGVGRGEARLVSPRGEESGVGSGSGGVTQRVASDMSPRSLNARFYLGHVAGVGILGLPVSGQLQRSQAVHVSRQWLSLFHQPCIKEAQVTLVWCTGL